MRYKNRSQVEEAGELTALLENATEKMKHIYYKRQGHLQVGSLGGGNHFIEIGKDNAGAVWIVIHSGSRGVGHGSATYYMQKASPKGKTSEGHYGFTVASQEGKDYIKDMAFCFDFALLNRKTILRRVIDAMQETGAAGNATGKLIHRNHNHAESKDGVKWIHRKGATHAEKGMYGVIPGNMRDGSFIVIGKGNKKSLNSSSHGAGRVLGRKQAKKTLNMKDFQNTMRGLVAPVDFRRLDESPFAYKNIFEVMELQKEMVEVVTHIQPLIVIKG